MEIHEIIISAFVTIFSAGLLIVSLASYKKYKNLKLLFVSVVFLIFFIKGVLLSFSLYSIEFPFISSFLSNGLFDLLVLILLFMATLKR